MEHRRFVRRLRTAMVGGAVAAVGLLTFAGSAHADSSVSVIEPVTCQAGSSDSRVDLAYSTSASFTTGVRIHVVSGTPDGPIIRTVTVELQGPTSTTIPFDLPPGVYYFDWEDRGGDNVTWSGRHSSLGDFYNGIYLDTKTTVVPCTVVTVPSIPTTPPSIPTTPTIVGEVLPTTPPPPTIPTVPGTPSPIPAIPTVPTVATVPPSAPTIPTTPSTPGTPVTAAPTSTTRPPTIDSVTTLPDHPPTGGDPKPLLAVGAAFLAAGVLVTAIGRLRRTPQPY